MTWLDAEHDGAITPESALPGVVNYFRGRDPGRWQTGIPTYARVRYQEMYPGIDVVYYGRGNRLEYDLVVAPYADPRAARLGVQGARASIRDSGDLDLTLDDGRVLRMRAPVAFQEHDGQRQHVGVRFRLETGDAGTAIALQLDPYDPGLQLIIDPLVYSTFVGGEASDSALNLVINAADEVILTGGTYGSFPVTAGALDSSRANGDAFVTRLNGDGSAIVYSTYFGGGGDDTGSGIAVNGSGDVFVTGTTSSTDFPATAGAFDPTHNGSMDVFVARLNSAGTALVYSTLLGGSGIEAGYDLVVNHVDQAFIVGVTFDAEIDFPTTPGALNSGHGGATDGFVARVSSNGSSLLYSTLFGGSDYEFATGIAINAASEAFVAGHTGQGLPFDTQVADGSATSVGTGFPTTAGAFDQVQNGEDDAFVLRLNSSGTALVYSTFLGGSGDDRGYAIDVNEADEAFVTGETIDADVDFPTTAGAYDTAHNGYADVFVTRLSSDGSTVGYSTLIGGGWYDAGLGIAVNDDDEAFLTGSTFDHFTTYPTTANAFDTSHNGSADAFVTRLNPSGTALIYSTFLGGGDRESGADLAINAQNEVFIVGFTNAAAAADFPVTIGAFDTTHNGSSDAFVARLTVPAVQSGALPPTDLQVAAASGSSITLRWAPPATGTPPTGYQIEGGVPPGDIVGALSLGPTPTVTFALPSGSFYLRVRTIAGAASSDPSNEVLVHINRPLPPAAPAGLLGVAVASTIGLSWKHILSGVPQASTVLDVTGALNLSVPLGLTETFSVTGVPPGTYTFRVRAVNASGSSAPSNPVTLTFPGDCSGTPRAPSNLLVYRIARTVFIFWDPPPSGPAPTDYLLNVSGALSGTLATSGRALSGTVGAGTYGIAVVARNPCGSSPPTGTQTVTVQ